MYTSYSYYEDNYLHGTNVLIPEEQFAYWEARAAEEINFRTYGRLAADPSLITDQVQMCACELAELLYRANSAMQMSAEHGGAGPLSSYSNDGESGTFDLSNSEYTVEGKTRKIREIIYKHLGFSGLLYAGVM